MVLSTDVRDNCCILHDGSICIVSSIVPHDNSYHLGVKRFLQVQDFYDIGISSSNTKVYKCAMLSEDITYISLHEITAKCFRMPFWNSMSTDDDTDEDVTRYVVIALIHSWNV